MFHGEHPSDEIEGLNKEAGFTAILDRIRARFPTLKLTMEHITSRAAVDWVKAQDEHVGASITVHHLFTTVDDVLGYSKASGGLMRVHCGCKPQPKWRDDRAALNEIVLSGHPRFFYGGDDAAHLRGRKESGGLGLRGVEHHGGAAAAGRPVRPRGEARPARPVPVASTARASTATTSTPRR